VGDEGVRSQTFDSRIDGILAASGNFDRAAPAILQALGEDWRWDVGIAWRVEEPSKILRFVSSWHGASAETALEKLSARSIFSPGVGLPGRTLSAQEPCWIRDVQKDRGFPRSPAAMEDGLHGAFAFPLLHGRRVVGVIELFSYEFREPDENLLVSMAVIGDKVGSFLEGDTG
jgi:hypothetical protein